MNKKDCLVLIDFQNVFINKHTKHLIPKIKNILDLNKYKHFIFMKFINKNNSVFVKNIGYKKCFEKKRNRNS